MVNRTKIINSLRAGLKSYQNQGLKKKKKKKFVERCLAMLTSSVGLAHTLAATAWSVRLFVCCLKHRGKLDKLGLDYFYNHMDCNCTGYALASGLCDMNDIVDDISTAAVCVGHQVPGGHHPSCTKKKNVTRHSRARDRWHLMLAAECRWS